VYASDRPEFTPPPPPGLLRAAALAVVAHLLLVLALTSGLRWQRDAQDVAVEAELWSALPQEAAPKERPAPPAPPPVVRAPPAPQPPVQRDADIALEREKQRREAAERRQAELERERERDRRRLEAQRKREAELARKKEEQKLAAENKRKEEERQRRQQEQEEKRVAQLREENLRRIAGMAGGSGAPSATGTAARASGPSAGWAGRVRARVKPNIVFSDDVAGNPTAEVEVRTSPDGTIVSKRLIKASGNKGWDEAVLRALDKTEVLPRDTDGRVPSPVTITFRPRD
jgi:colicin import membrane protein